MNANTRYNPMNSFCCCCCCLRHVRCKCDYDRSDEVIKFNDNNSSGILVVTTYCVKMREVALICTDCDTKLLLILSIGLANCQCDGEWALRSFHRNSQIIMWRWWLNPISLDSMELHTRKMLEFQSGLIYICPFLSLLVSTLTCSFVYAYNVYLFAYVCVCECACAQRYMLATSLLIKSSQRTDVIPLCELPLLS